jgi:hypothetical protein
VVSPSFDFAQDIRKKPFALRFSKGERFAKDKLVEPQKILLQEAQRLTFRKKAGRRAMKQ